MLGTQDASRGRILRQERAKRAQLELKLHDTQAQTVDLQPPPSRVKRGPLRLSLQCFGVCGVVATVLLIVWDTRTIAQHTQDISRLMRRARPGGGHSVPPHAGKSYEKALIALERKHNAT